MHFFTDIEKQEQILNCNYFVVFAETNIAMAEDADANSCLDDAFTTSMLKKNDEALAKLQQAIDNSENFDIGKCI